MDNRDEIIQIQTDLIGQLINRNLNSVASDLWGPTMPTLPKKPEEAPKKAKANDKTPSPAAQAAPGHDGRLAA